MNKRCWGCERDITVSACFAAGFQWHTWNNEERNTFKAYPLERLWSWAMLSVVFIPRPARVFVNTTVNCHCWVEWRYNLWFTLGCCERARLLYRLTQSTFTMEQFTELTLKKRRIPRTISLSLPKSSWNKIKMISLLFILSNKYHPSSMDTNEIHFHGVWVSEEKLCWENKSGIRMLWKKERWTVREGHGLSSRLLQLVDVKKPWRSKLFFIYVYAIWSLL